MSAVAADPDWDASWLVSRGGVRLRVRFSHESLPDWIRDFAGWQSAEYLVVLEVSHADMAQAAQAWDSERQAFPAR